MPIARRTDNRLRESINSLESMLLTQATREAVFSEATSLLMHLLEANYGFCYQCSSNNTSDNARWDFIDSLKKTNGVVSNQTAQSTSYEIPERHKDKIIVGRAFVLNTEQLQVVPAPSNHPALSNCIAVPLSDAKNIYGVIYIGNIPNTMVEGIENRLRPFIAATNCLLRVRPHIQTHHALPQKKRINDLTELENIFTVFDSLFNTVFLVDNHENIIICNKASTVMFGMPKYDIIGKSITYFLPNGSPRLDTRIASIINNNDLPKSVWRGVPVIKADKTRALVDLSSFEFNSAIGTLKGYVMDDISERMESAANYHDTLQRFQVLTNLAPIAIIQISTSWECTYANDTWCNYTQMTPEESTGKGWINGLHHDDVSKTLDKIRIQSTSDSQYEGQFRLRTPLGKTIWVKANACMLYNSNGESDGLIITFNDITDHLNNEKRLQNIAERDQLTGLVNRAFFNDRLEMALKGVSRFDAVALIFLDLDDFKHINDTLGHDAGDTLLEQIAQRLITTLRDVDTIARIGGDEFTLIITNVESTHNVSVIADRLINCLAEPFDINNRPIYASASLGISYTDSINQKPKTVLKQADVALYKAKEAGKNQYRFYSQELDKHAHLNILLRQSLKDSHRHDFSIVYQPQVNAQTGAIVGVEALTRWSHEESKSDENTQMYINIIEQTGLINEFSEWLFEQVLSDVERWTKKHLLTPELKISINVSAKQFRNKDLALFIHERCLQHNVSPSCITLEITESAIIDDPKQVFDILRQLSLFGFLISLDDFGTGYSSLSYLQKMPINEVKIDRSFIKDIASSNEDKKIVLAIINLAKTLGLSLIAEGVDNTSVRDWLIEQECFIQQGFYFHKPLHKPQIESLLETNHIIKSQKVVKLQNTIKK